MGERPMEPVNPAFVLQEVKKVSFEDRLVPQLRDEYHVRVHIEQTGICGSDVHYWQRGSLDSSPCYSGRIGDFVLESPIVLGHESSGTIVEVGKRVKNVKVGDRVAIEPGVPCRHCDYCRSGIYNVCEDTIFAATPPWDGTLQKYYVVTGDYTYPFPDHMSMEDGALVEPVAVAVQICKVANLKGGQTVLVFGCGPIGAVGVDISEARAKFAKEFAADDVYVSKRDDGGPADPVEAARALSCIQAGIFAAKRGGTFVQVGMGKENVVFPITIACIRVLTIKGSIRYQSGCYPEAIKLVASGKVNPWRLITHRFKFEEAEEAFEIVRKAEENTLKVVIQGVKD
ncbi:GroES-like protein [Xylaria acuta]|nr:GroES-like protein [Xylaria acuta]